MRALIQVVDEAKVTVDNEVKGEIARGLLIFLGVGEDDTEANGERLWKKIKNLRIFPDEKGKTNWNIDQVEGEVLIISQFTLFADMRRGNRPSFTSAACAKKGEVLYEHFLSLAEKDVPVQRGVFGADMRVALINAGPFTVWLDTDDLAS